MIVAVTSFNCRVRGCAELWLVANDGSFDKYPEFMSPERVAELRRDAHEIRCHAESQFEEVYYDSYR